MEQVNPSKKIHSLIISTLKSKFLSPVGKTSNLLIALRSEVALFSTGSTKISYVTFLQSLRFLAKTGQSLLVLLQEEGKDPQVQQQSSCSDLMSEGGQGEKGGLVTYFKGVNISKTCNKIQLCICCTYSSDNSNTPGSFRIFPSPCTSYTLLKLDTIVQVPLTKAFQELISRAAYTTVKGPQRDLKNLTVSTTQDS